MQETPPNGLVTERTNVPGLRQAPQEKRRSRRLRVRIPLLLDWGCGIEASWTVTVNEGGALVTSSRLLEAGRRIKVFNVTTGRTAIARVVSPLLSKSERAPTRAASDYRLALRLETFRARFWGHVYHDALAEPQSAS